MSTAARGAAGYLYASGRIRNRDAQARRQRDAERAAEALKLERDKRFSTGAKAPRR